MHAQRLLCVCLVFAFSVMMLDDWFEKIAPHSQYIFSRAWQWLSKQYSLRVLIGSFKELEAVVIDKGGSSFALKKFPSKGR